MNVSVYEAAEFAQRVRTGARFTRIGRTLPSSVAGWRHVHGAGRRGRWRLHQHEPGPVQVPHQTRRCNPGHDVVRVVDPFTALVPEGKGKGVGDFFRLGGAEAGCVRHDGTIGDNAERNKNLTQSSPAVRPSVKPH